MFSLRRTVSLRRHDTIEERVLIHAVVCYLSYRCCIFTVPRKLYTKLSCMELELFGPHQRDNSPSRRLSERRNRETRSAELEVSGRAAVGRIERPKRVEAIQLIGLDALEPIALGRSWTRPSPIVSLGPWTARDTSHLIPYPSPRSSALAVVAMLIIVYVPSLPPSPLRSGHRRINFRRVRSR